MGGWSNDVWLWGNLGLHPAAVSGNYMQTVGNFFSTVQHGPGFQFDAQSGSAIVSSTVLQQLLQALPSLIHGGSSTDSVLWKLSDNKIFFLASCYKELTMRYVTFGPDNRYDQYFSDIWKFNVPLNVRAFGQRRRVDRIHTKGSLILRGIISASSNLACDFCDEVNESSGHSLLALSKVVIIWKEIANQLGLDFIMFQDFKESFCRWSLACRRLNIKRSKVGSIWLAIV